jgi:hypothetical protein
MIVIIARIERGLSGGIVQRFRGSGVKRVFRAVGIVPATGPGRELGDVDLWLDDLGKGWVVVTATEWGWIGVECWRG